MDCFLGLDLGTSGLRGVVLSETGECVAEAVITWPQPERDPHVWRQALETVLAQIRSHLPSAYAIRAVSACSTSGSILPLDRQGRPLHGAILYCDPVPEQLGIPNSWGLAKWLAWQEAFPEVAAFSVLAHPTDWLLQQMGGSRLVTDHTNALKSGFDPQSYAWKAGLPVEQFPEVVAPGTVIGEMDPAWGLGKGVVVAGLTDGCAAQVAAGAWEMGQVCTSLGTTLIFKAACQDYADSGSLYSHLHPDRRGWWVGAASSTGGGILGVWFPGEDLAAWDARIAKRPPTGIPSYPLAQPGERYPLADPDYPGFLPAAEVGSVDFYQALLEGIACVERYGIEQLPVPYPKQVFTTGGACRSRVWLGIRAGVLQCPLVLSRYPQPAYGAAMVAAAGWWQCGVSTAGQGLWRAGEVIEPGSLDYTAQYEAWLARIPKA
jgi:sugar (pentulose or hexulose) kinase